jgi:predicted nuclease with TOPRIM domain
MNKNLVTIILLVACAGLAVALIVVNNTQKAREVVHNKTILEFSNELTNARDQINGLSQVNLLLTNDLATSRKEAEALSNQLSDAKLSAAQEQQQLVDLTNQLAELEQRNQELDQHATELTNQLAKLNDEIAATQLELSQSKTNNIYLETELKKQVADRTALEQKFNDLSQMREQVHKLKEDALIATRLKWIKEGTDPSRQVKGGQLLMQHNTEAAAAQQQQTTPSDLNVEVESGGAIRVLPPTTTVTVTNSPQ